MLARTETVQLNKSNVTLSVSTVRRRREKNREAQSKKIKESFIPTSFLTIHWDGKLFEKKGSSQKENRLAIVVTGKEQEKVLEIPVTDSGTGKDEAEAVFKSLQKWDLTDKIKAMCFDTTNSNTGPNIGACKILEEKIGRKLYETACRHHVAELIPSGIFNELFEKGKTEGPKITLFDNFKKAWDTIEEKKLTDQWTSGLSDEKLSSFLSPLKESCVNFARAQLSVHQPRGDYKKVLQLILHFFGEDQNKVYNSFMLQIKIYCYIARLYKINQNGDKINLLIINIFEEVKKVFSVSK